MGQLRTRSDKHKALDVFLGRWAARGISYGNTDESGPDPKSNGKIWLSMHEGRWHAGSFFFVQEEQADISGDRFDTLSIMGVGEDGAYFARSFENHGFYRHYEITRDSDSWRLSGPTERSTIRFTGGNPKQVSAWEWKREDEWVSFCDRTADLPKRRLTPVRRYAQSPRVCACPPKTTRNHRKIAGSIEGSPCQTAFN